MPIYYYWDTIFSRAKTFGIRVVARMKGEEVRGRERKEEWKREGKGGGGKASSARFE
jgi:hypothetical protein